MEHILSFPELGTNSCFSHPVRHTASSNAGLSTDMYIGMTVVRRGGGASSISSRYALSRSNADDIDDHYHTIRVCYCDDHYPVTILITTGPQDRQLEYTTARVKDWISSKTAQTSNVKQYLH